MRTRRLIAALLAGAMAFSLTACGQEEASSSGSQPTVGGEGIVQSEDKPTPQVNLITGEALGEGMTPGQRPVAIMINNAQAALPQRGIGSADAILEMETEGGVTRFLALFANAASIPQVGPVRSSRDQHLQFVLPLNAIFVHIGSSIYAQNLLNQYQYQDIDGLYLGVTSFLLDEERRKTRGQEHCWYTDAALIAAGMEQNGLAADGAKNTLLPFLSPDASPMTPQDGDAPDISFNASATTSVQLTYDAASGTYLKNAYGSAQIDESTGAQLAFRNVLVLFATVTLKPDGNCTDFDLTGGEGYYCWGGKYQKIRWEKGDVTEPLRLFDADGNELSVNTGKSYIAVISETRRADIAFGGLKVEAAPEAAASGSAAPASGSTAE